MAFKYKNTAVIIAAAVLLGVVVMRLFEGSIQKHFLYDETPFGNPLMGFAPCAWYETVSDDVTLLYMDITWRELEPTEGFFDWESIENENQLDRWREEGKHIVLRFVCDIPDDEAHLDIPDWLYEKLNGDGTVYDISYGRGFSPNYGNEALIDYHKKAVQALGKRYGQDSLISFIELGSLGHWGEWHVNYSEGVQRLPNRDIREQYVTPWLEAFPRAKILMRRPFAEAERYGLGLYNDMAGHGDETLRWFNWIQYGGKYSQTGETDAIVPIPEVWKSAPIGGELTSSIEMEQMLCDDLQNTLLLVQNSHTTFLGPKIAQEQYETGYNALLAGMGYRLWISDMKISPKFGGGVQVELVWQNSGVAPIYENWTANLYIIDDTQQLAETAAVEIDLPALLPGETVKTKTLLRQVKSLRELGQYTIKLGIVDPMTGKNAVRFSMKDVLQYRNAVVLY